MKRILNHFFYTLMMLIAVGFLFVLPEDGMSSYINWTILGLIVLVLVGTGIYLYRGRSKGLFALIFVCVMLCPVVGNARSRIDTSEIKSYYQSQADSISTDFCKLADEFDADKAIKDPEKAPKEEDIVNARKYLDILVDAAKAGASLVESKSVSGGILSILPLVGTNSYGEKEICAYDYLSEVAEYIQKKYETSMTTVYKVLEADNNTCWPCGIVHLAMQAVEHICVAIEDKMKAAALGLLGIIFLFWILLKVLMLIGQFGTGDNGAFFTAFLTRAFLAVIAAAILQTPLSWLYGQTISPLIGISAGISQKFLEEGNARQGFSSSTANSNGMGSRLAGATNLACACCDTSSTSDCNKGTIELIEYQNKTGSNTDQLDSGQITNKGLLSKETKRELLCLTCSTYKQTAPMISAGRVLIYWSLHERTEAKKLIRNIAAVFTAGAAYLVPIPFSWWILGVILVFAFGWLAFSIAFRFIDIFLRIGFAFLLTPLLVTCFVFPITRQYTQRGWEFLAHAILSMLALALGISLIMSIFMAGLPSTVTTALSGLMQQTDDPSNTYADNLYAAFAGGGFYTVFFIFIILFVGLSVIKASQVIIEGLSGITSSIPSLSGAAVMGAIHASLAPYHMVKAATLDGLTRANAISLKGKGDKGGDFEAAPSKASKLGQFTESGVKTTGQAMEKGGQAVEKGGAAVGKGMEAAGKGAASAGQGMMQAGSGLSATGVGAIAGVPLMAVGAATTAAGYGAQAAGKGVEAGSKAAGQGMQAAGKATQKAAKPIGKATEKTAEGAGKAKKGGSTLGKVGMEAWDLADQAIDKGLAEGDKSVEDEHMPEPDPAETKSDNEE